MITLGIKKHIEQLSINLPKYFDAIALANTSHAYCVIYDHSKDLYFKLIDTHYEHMVNRIQEELENAYELLRKLTERFRLLSPVHETDLADTLSPEMIEKIKEAQGLIGVDKIIYHK
jgi:hypothetical protein